MKKVFMPTQKVAKVASTKVVKSDCGFLESVAYYMLIIGGLFIVGQAFKELFNSKNN